MNAKYLMSPGLTFYSKQVSVPTQRGRGVATYCLLSLVFITINILTLSNLPPWIDEVMFLDTSYNAAFHGSWQTTAWYRVAGQRPFATYPPLYQLLTAGWMWLAGSSLVVVRSLNLLITFVLGAVCLRAVHRLSPLTAALFALLLWGTSEMAWMYRNGRPDLLCALVFVFAVQAMQCHLKAKSPATCLAVVATSALTVWSGFQTAACICVLCPFLFVLKGRRKQVATLIAIVLVGLVLGSILLGCFMLAHHRLLAFACSIVPYSATLSAIALAVLPWAGDVFGFPSMPYVQKLLQLGTPASLCQQMAAFAGYRSFLVLAVTTFSAYVTCFRHDLRMLMRDEGFLSLLFALVVPVAMMLAGRFTPYYLWMAYLPLLMAAASVATRFRRWRVVLIVVALAMTIGGIRSLQSPRHWNYGNLRSFVVRQYFQSTDAVVCPFSLFYELKPVCDTCYFVGIFPSEYLGHVDYIVESTSGNEFDQPITSYLNKLREDSAFVLTAIDHCHQPSLTLYKVEKRP